MFQQVVAYYQEWLTGFNLHPDFVKFLTNATLFGAVLIFAWITNFVTKQFILTAIKRYAAKSENQYDDVFIEKKVFNRLSQIAPALVIYFLIKKVFPESETLVHAIQIVAKIYMAVIAILVTDSFVNALHDIYQMFPVSKSRPIKGYIQIAKILIYFIGTIFIIAILLNKSPFALLAGLGAMAAVLMLVFKDTIMGFVASIQLSANDMVKIGDWITMNSKGADGIVSEINLNTVKVQNFDKTISTIPTYSLVSESFTNWKGMEESDGRRIKRFINIDMQTVHFADEEMQQRFSSNPHLTDFMTHWLSENKNSLAGKQLTNLWIFRKYMEQYLKADPRVNSALPMYVRLLQPAEHGIPVEIYVFTHEKGGYKFETVQSEIFDHIITILPEFDLAVFQNPTGNDVKKGNAVDQA